MQFGNARCFILSVTRTKSTMKSKCWKKNGAWDNSFICHCHRLFTGRFSCKQTLNGIACETLLCWPATTRIHNLSVRILYVQQNVGRICDNHTTHVNKRRARERKHWSALHSIQRPMMNSFPLTTFDTNTHTHAI